MITKDVIFPPGKEKDPGELIPRTPQPQTEKQPLND